jgi:hypothetical protein
MTALHGFFTTERSEKQEPCPLCQHWTQEPCPLPRDEQSLNFTAEAMHTKTFVFESSLLQSFVFFTLCLADSTVSGEL